MLFRSWKTYRKREPGCELLGGLMRPWLCTFYHFPCTSLPRDVHQATHRRTKEPVSPLQDSFSKCEGGFVAGSTFKRNKPGKTKFCQGDAHPVLILRAVKSHSFVFFFFPTPSGMWDLSSPTGDQICAPCSGSVES